MIFECEDCGTLYPEEFVTQWGRHEQSNGMGPHPVCVELIDNPSAPKPKNSNGDTVNEPALQQCKGHLQRNDRAKKDELHPLYKTIQPIQPGRRL